MKDEDVVQGSIVLFENSRSAIRAEHVLKRQGFSVRLAAPPPEIRRGCDLCLRIDARQQLMVLQRLDEEGIRYLGVAAFTGGQRPVELCTRKDFGSFVMIKSGNMKLTFSKDTLRIVNVSGGGCPDIPYLAEKLLNRPLAEVSTPLEGASSLCAYLLEQALCEAKKWCEV